MHQRADANSRPDGDRARQRDPCMRTCVYACASPCAIGHLRPLLPPPGYVPLLTRTNETRGSTFGAQRIVEGTRMVRNVRLEEREQLFPRDTLSRFDVKPAPIFFRPFRREFSPAFLPLSPTPAVSSLSRLRCSNTRLENTKACRSIWQGSA